MIPERKPLFLQLLANEVEQCNKCSILCASRKKTVPGEGNVDARIMIIGEAPGENEDKEGLPFIGKAGKMLNNILRACWWKREDVFVANIIKCRPPKNRVPIPQEINNCISYLNTQIDVVNPEFLLLLGSVASQTLVGMPISDARGRWHLYKGRQTICTWHPSYLSRNPAAKQNTWADLGPLREAMLKPRT